jgi:uncharacterized protein YaiL (DUF2058 family)
VSKSLQEQLRELGLARDRPGQGAGKNGGRQKPRNAQRPQPPQPPQPPTAADVSLEQAFRLREQAEMSEARRAKLRKQEEDRQRHELNQAIKAIVEPDRLNDASAEEARYFLYKGRIRKVHVTTEQLAALNEGRLGLVYLAGGYHILAPEQVEAVRKISPEHVVELDTGGQEPVL